ncbi:MAG: ubiquinone/menaquinone biosynthesis methyltransferase [Candidatus Micrarchaeota archaeon]|nr:ubiquinone/menaquinone biosynthesis methyltransferase [Candidatus Micrarchaeota archaeon]
MEGEQNFFTDVAKNYDKLSKSLTAGLDNIWRRRAVEMAAGYEKASVLDIATGTGNVALLLAKKYKDYRIVGIDFNKEMLEIAREKSKGLRNVRYVNGDVESLKMKSNSFDVVMLAFALGTFEDLPKALSEMKRVLKPGGKLILLDINKSRSKLFNSFLNAYQMFSLTPTFSGEIRREINMFIHSKKLDIDKQMLLHLLEQSGLKEIKCRDMSFRTVFIISCVK